MIFPIPKYEKYETDIYDLKEYDSNLDLVFLFEKYKSGNADIKVKSDVSFSEDEYTLVINENGIEITVAYDSGLFRAITTLKQLIKQNGSHLPWCEIKDSPDFAKRSYMLDISRGRIPKRETIMHLIDILAELKYNEFQLYMESFCFKYETLNEYTKDLNCLDADDIKFLDQYCADRFIDFVPNQNSFGHLYSWLNHPDFRHLAVGDDTTNTGTINPLVDESFEFVDKLYSALLPNYRSEYVNIGLDEAFGLGKFQLKELCENVGADNVFMDWLNKLADHIKKKYNKKVQFWSDMVSGYPESFERVPEGAIALNWGYDVAESVLLEKKCSDLESKNIPYYICSGNSVWLAFTGRFDVCSVNFRTCAELGRKYNALGYMVTDWGNGGHPHFPVWSYLPATLGGQYAWNAGGPIDVGNLKNDFIRSSIKYVDEYIFGGAKVSEWLYRLQQYYLYEPERVHCSTICGISFNLPLGETAIEPFFDLKVCGDSFYFENVKCYVEKCMEAVEQIEFDEVLKRQVLLNAKMVVLASELCVIRKNQSCESTKIDVLIKLIDEIHDEFVFLWDKDNHPDGRKIFLLQLEGRRKELLEL